MIIEKLNKNGSENVFSLITVTQKILLHIRQNPNHNQTFDISAISTPEENEQPDPLRIPEILIVLGVLLIWCASIVVFIRHSELLRIRHRDLPFRSSMKASLHSSHLNVVRRTSDQKSLNQRFRLSSASPCTTPKVSAQRRSCRISESLDRRSLSIMTTSQPLGKRKIGSLDINTTHRYSKDYQPMLPRKIKTSSVSLHQDRLCDRFPQVKPFTSVSITDIYQRRPMRSNPNSSNKTRSQESPV